MSEERTISGLQKTRELKQISQTIEMSRTCETLCYLFDEYPIFDIRKAVLERLLSGVAIRLAHVEWIERRVFDLKEEEDHDQTSRSFWSKMLNWYIFNTSNQEGSELADRAIEFAIGITKREYFGLGGAFFYRSDILKMIAGRLTKDPDVYWGNEKPSLKTFLESFLSSVCAFNYLITDYEMVDVKRIVRIVDAVHDWAFISHLEKVLAKVYQSQEEQHKKAYDLWKEVEILQLQAYLKEVIRCFKEREAEEATKEQ